MILGKTIADRGITLHLLCIIEESLMGWWFASDSGLNTNKQSDISELGEYKVKLVLRFVISIC
jgi:hypothetical protein